MKAYILAGGKSTRLGRDKGIEPIKGKPMISYLLDTLSTINVDVSIIANNDNYSHFQVPVITDIVAEKGPLGGILTAISHANEDSIVLSVDTPFISEKNVLQLMKRYKKGSISVVESDTILFPLFGIYPLSLIESLKQTIHSNNLKLIKFLLENNVTKITLQLSDLEKLNINNLENLQTAERLLQNEN
ncbi:MAG: molybdenum cofactor guanylyltransferase [Candidatus Kapabacteria bacterium]|nr:molybdenum cofactor guanylyltransferase [Candidatus Kapabacteria bacterium]